MCKSGVPGQKSFSAFFYFLGHHNGLCEGKVQTDKKFENQNLGLESVSGKIVRKYIFEKFVYIVAYEEPISE